MVVYGAMSPEMLQEESDAADWEESVRRMTQMSQDVDDGLYDDVLDPLREAADRLLTTQMPHGYAYDLDECVVVRTDPGLPVYFTIKSDEGDDLPVGAPTVIHPSELEADPERYETRDRPTPPPAQATQINDSFAIKGAAGNDPPVPAVAHPADLRADSERHETRT